MKRVSTRVADERRRHRTVDGAFAVADADAEVGGGIIAGALAYRLFIWLLPLALVLVVGLGLTADARSTTPQATADSAALIGLVPESVAAAAESPNRWYALLVGVPALMLATRSVLRVLIGGHRLSWGEALVEAPKPTLPAALRLLLLLLAIPVAAAAANYVRAESAGAGLAAGLAMSVVYALIWLAISIRLPHRDARWTALLPGAAMFGLGALILDSLGKYAVAPYASSKEGTYGALGTAAVLLFALFIVGRLMLATAVVNATIWERRSGNVAGRSGNARRVRRGASLDR
jgi:hypothetical protein